MRGLSILVLSVSLLWSCSSGGDHGRPPNKPPEIGPPTGPGSVGGADPAFTASITGGDSLAFDVTATDPNGKDDLTLTATVTGGSLTASQAGFNEVFPVVMTGRSPLTLSLTGTSVAAGDIEITLRVEDRRGKSDSITHGITILNDAPAIGSPSGPGTVSGSHPAYLVAIATGDSLAFDVTATDPNPSQTLTFTASVSAGSITAAQAGFNEPFPAVASGATPVTLSFTGTAAVSGDLEITFSVDDGVGGTDTITLGIAIVSQPRIVQASFVDANLDCLVSAGDLIEVTFTHDVTVSGGVAPDQAFQVLPPVASPFGTSPAWVATSGVVLSFQLGSGIGIEVNGTFGVDPTASGIDVGTPPGVIYETASPAVHATQVDPVNPGVDIGGSIAISVVVVRYLDDGDRVFGAGDTLEIDFCGLVDVMGGTPDTELLLPVAGDTFGTGATFQGILPLLGVATVVVVLGTNPTLQSNGTFDPLQLTAGHSSGLDVDPLQTQIFQTGTSTLLTPSSPPGRDISGVQYIGRWNAIGSAMTEPRRSHTATLLANGEVLLVGGFNDQQTGPSAGAGFLDTLATIEIFDPGTGAFTAAAGSLVHPRARHNAVRTPGPDGVIDTNDDYVVIIGGWNSMVVENNGPRSEGTVEVIWPDPDADGDTSDLVVNWSPGGPPWTPSGTAVGDKGAVTFVGVGPAPACMDVTISVGMEDCTFSWTPETHLFGPGNNELLCIGGYISRIWDDCNGGLSSWFMFSMDGGCNVSKPGVYVDADNDGDLFDNNPNDEGCLITDTGFGAPWTTPMSFTRSSYSQTRIPGPDGLDGTVDDAYLTYGGSGFDLTLYCFDPGRTCQSILGNLEYFDFGASGAALPNNNDAYSGCGAACATCGLECGIIGQPTDRMDHSAVLLPGPAQEVVLLSGWSTGNAVSGVGCTSVAEIITPDLTDPMLSTIRPSGTDLLEHRVRGQMAGVLAGSGNVLLAGGYDSLSGTATASTVYLQVVFDRFDPVADLSSARRDAASVSIPGGVFPGIPDDRVYFFGGWDDSQVTLGSVEYFTE